MKCFRVWTAALVAGALFCAATALGQGETVVEGKLVNGTDPSIVAAGLQLDVVSLEGGMSVLQSMASDSTGGFSIDGLPRNSMLMIQVDYRGVNYHGPISFDDSGKAEVEIKIYEPTDSMKGIELESVQVAFQMEGEQLKVLESYSFDNRTDPPRTYVGEQGGIRFSRTEGIPGLPRLSVRAPGAAFPLTQTPSASPDGESIISLYPLRPGVTTFNLEQSLPYGEHRFTYRKRFYHDVGAINVGVVPKDMQISGEGLVKVETEAQPDFAVYSIGPADAGTEFLWTLSGGTPAAANTRGESRIVPIPTAVGRNALVAGPLILMGLVLVLWYAATHMLGATLPGKGKRTAELKARRNLLVSQLATLDNQFENQALARTDYRRQRELGMSQLRRISMLLSRK